MVDKKSVNPLEGLLTDATQSVDPAELLSLLKPFIRLSAETGSVIFTQKGMSLSANKKVLLFILSKKVKLILKLSESELVEPREIKAGLGKNIPSGTIDVSLKRLSDAGVIKGDNGKYFVPEFNLPEVKKILGGSQDE